MFGLPDYLAKRMARYPSNRVLPVITATSDRTLASRESGSQCDNYGAGGAVTFNLPTSTYKGMYFKFTVAAAQNLEINPGDSDQIIANGSTLSAGTSITANDEGEQATIYWNGSVWIADVTGTWT